MENIRCSRRGKGVRAVSRGRGNAERSRLCKVSGWCDLGAWRIGAELRFERKMVRYSLRILMISSISGIRVLGEKKFMNFSVCPKRNIHFGFVTPTPFLTSPWHGGQDCRLKVSSVSRWRNSPSPLARPMRQRSIVSCGG